MLPGLTAGEADSALGQRVGQQKPPRVLPACSRLQVARTRRRDIASEPKEARVRLGHTALMKIEPLPAGIAPPSRRETCWWESTQPGALEDVPVADA